MIALRIFFISLLISCLTAVGFTQHDDHQHPQTEQAGATADSAAPHDHDPAAAHTGCGHPDDPNKPFSAGETALHHIADANTIHIFGDLYLPLPAFLYAPGEGWTMTATSVFHPHPPANGTQAYNRYVLVHGNIMRIKDVSFPMDVTPVSEPTHEARTVNGKEKTIYFVQANDNCYELEAKTSFDGGMMGGGITGFYDFSITRNVFTMLLTVLVLFLVFRSVAVS